MAFQAPVTVLQANTKRDTGKKAQYGNIMAGKVSGRGQGRGGRGAARARSRRWRERRSNAGRRFSASRRGLTARPACRAASLPQAVADIVRTTLGPRAMLKMLLDANGGIVLTNDGAAGWAGVVGSSRAAPASPLLLAGAWSPPAACCRCRCRRPPAPAAPCRAPCADACPRPCARTQAMPSCARLT